MKNITNMQMEITGLERLGTRLYYVTCFTYEDFFKFKKYILNNF